MALPEGSRKRKLSFCLDDSSCDSQDLSSAHSSDLDDFFRPGKTVDVDKDETYDMDKTSDRLRFLLDEMAKDGKAEGSRCPIVIESSPPISLLERKSGPDDVVSISSDDVSEDAPFSGIGESISDSPADLDGESDHGVGDNQSISHEGTHEIVGDLDQSRGCASPHSLERHEAESVPHTGGTKAHSESLFIAFCGEEAAFFDRRAGAATSSESCPQHPDEAPNCDFFGMGDSVRQAVFEVYKIEKLHAWQTLTLDEHLSAQDSNQNVLIHAPTSGGKTLVAILLLLRTMILEKKDCMFVLPFVAIVTEKAQELRRLSRLLPVFTVAEYASSKGAFPVPRQKSSLRTLYVCTPEKATGVWKSLCTDGCRRSEIGMIAVDECHMICDESRGAVVEELLVSLLHWSRAPILGLSATIGGLESYQSFLGGGRTSQCALFDVLSRPTEISENMIVAGMVIPISRDDHGKGALQKSKARSDIMDEVQDRVLLESDLLKNDGHANWSWSP